MEGVRKHSNVVYLVLATTAFVLAIVASALPNWSHVNGGSINVPQLVNFGPWRVCVRTLNLIPPASKICEALDKSYVEDNGPFTALLFTLSNSQWSEVLAVRGLTVIGLVFGGTFVVAAALSMVMTRWQNLLETIAYKGQFLVGLLGFIVTCIWANFGERDGFRYGASFICHLVSWLVAIAAGLAGVWSRGEGVPDIVSRFATPLVSLFVFVLSLSSTALVDWGHGETAHKTQTNHVEYVADMTYGLWKFCSEDVGALQDTRACFKYASSVEVPYTGGGAFHVSRFVDFSSSDLSALKGCQAMSILCILAATLALVGVVFGRVSNNQSHILYRLRIPAAALAFIFSFILMCVYTSFLNTRATSDLGSAFAINCCVWVLALLWVVQHVRGGGAAASSGGGYAVTTGNDATPYASV